MMKTQLISLLLTCGLGLTSQAFAESASSQSSAKAAPPLEYGTPVSLETAKKIALAAEAEAKKNGFTMAIVIVDSGSNLVYLEKIDNTQYGSIDVAIGKAKTANNFKRPTKAMEDAVAGGRNSLITLPNVVLIEGGLPIVIDGKIAGAIGVSGGNSVQDAQIASAGLAAISK